MKRSTPREVAFVDPGRPYGLGFGARCRFRGAGTVRTHRIAFYGLRGSGGVSGSGAGGLPSLLPGKAPAGGADPGRGESFTGPPATCSAVSPHGTVQAAPAMVRRL